VQRPGLTESVQLVAVDEARMKWQAASRASGSNPAIRTALLMNFIAPYRLPLLRRLAAQVGELRIFVSTRMEPNRSWTPDWTGLQVVLQKTLTLPWEFRRHTGVRQQTYLHFPFDTIPHLLRYDPAVIISGELGMRSLQAAMYRALRRDCRLIIWATLSEHTEHEWGLLRRCLRRAILAGADAVVVNGSSGDRYIRRFNRDVPIVTMRQPVDVTLFSQRPIDRSAQQARRLIFSGRLIGAKGVVAAQADIAAWAAAHPDRLVEITWAGDGEMRAVLEQNPVPGNMRQTFTGHVGYQELAQLYSESGALLLPTLFDEWGLVVNEAMASGIPVLGSIYSQAVEELVEDGSTGWRFDPLQPGSFAAALDRFFGASLPELSEFRTRARARGMSITFETAASCLVRAIEAAVPARQAA
jgi:glycosyltransferase involved in cell wall biosynthesis